MRRRTKPRVVWLPPTNANSIGVATFTTGLQDFFVDAVGDRGDFAVGEIPLVLDGEQDPIGAADLTLSDLENSGYRLRRIVGKIWIATIQEVNGGPHAVCITAGIIVRRIDPVSGQSVASLTLDGEELAPAQIRNVPDPWIWRRSWLSTNTLATGNKGPIAQTLITNNFTNAGSASDGPHVDQKTARIVGAEERLFLTVSSTVIQGGDDAQSSCKTIIMTDLRVLATMRTSIGNRRNASR